MKKEKELELKSPKVQSLIGKIPLKIVFAAISIYVSVLILIAIVAQVLGMDVRIFLKNITGI